MLITLDGPQDAHSTTGSGHFSNTRVFESFEFGVIGPQDGLVQDQSNHGINQGSA